MEYRQSTIQIEFITPRQCFSLYCFRSSYTPVLCYGYRKPILVILNCLTNYRAVILIRRACFRSDNATFVRLFLAMLIWFSERKNIFSKSITNWQGYRERVPAPVKVFFFEPSSEAKCLCTKSERQTLSSRVPWVWSERDNLYSQQKIPPRKTKT